MQETIAKVESQFKKKKLTDVRSGDSVRVSQKVKEGGKERVQTFEGMVIRTRNANSLAFTITVRRIACGVGVEKVFMMHSPLITKVEVLKRGKVRRNYLTYMRERGGKKTRLAGLDFDESIVNVEEEVEAPKEEKTEDSKESKAEAKPKEEKTEDKPKEPKSEEKPTEEKAAKDGDKPETKEPEDKKEVKEDPKKLSKEDKAKAKKDKAEEFRKSQQK